MPKTAKRAALYVRVSTDKQTIENQVDALTEVAQRRGWTIVGDPASDTDHQAYSDEGISGTKGRDGRPGLDRLLKDASSRKFDVVMAWSLDRLGRSLVGLMGTIDHLQQVGVDIYLDKQSIDTTSAQGKLLFHITGAFAEFERNMIVERTCAGLNVIKAKLAKDGKFEARGSGIVRTRLGRPPPDPAKLAAARSLLATGTGIIKVAKAVGLGVGTVHKLSKETA